jgi:ABC-type branched-subunit amino acid transport system permease subunit
MIFEFYVSRATNYYLATALILGIYLVIYVLRHSNTGLAMSAVRAILVVGGATTSFVRHGNLGYQR